jgi:hypothetical protein
MKAVVSKVDSSRMENSRGDGMIPDPLKSLEANYIILSHNIIRNNGVSGIRTRGNFPMGYNRTGDTVMPGFNHDKAKPVVPFRPVCLADDLRIACCIPSIRI